MRIFPSFFFICLLALAFTACEEDQPTPSLKNKLIVEGVEYPVDYVLVEVISDNDRMIELKSFLDTGQTQSITLFMDLAFDGSREIPAGIYTFTGPTGLQRSGLRLVDQSWVVLNNSSLAEDNVTSLTMTVSGEDGGNLKVKGTIHYTHNGNKKVEVDYEGSYDYDD
jgi:hypothetical protein